MNVEVGCNPGIIKLRQDNQQKAEAACSIGVGQGASAKLDSKVKNKLAMDISQKAVGINPMAFFIIIAIIMGIILLSPMLMVAFVGTKIFLIMGVIIMMIGLGNIPVYILSRVKEDKLGRKNGAFLFVDEKKVKRYGNPVVSNTYGEIMKQYKSDDNIIAVDFFPFVSGDCVTDNCSNNNPPPNPCTPEIKDGNVTGKCNKITGQKTPGENSADKEKFPVLVATGDGGQKYSDNVKGSAVFYSYISPSVALGSDGCPTQGPNGECAQPCISFNKEQSESYWLYTGIGMTVVGLVFIILGAVFSRKKTAAKNITNIYKNSGEGSKQATSKFSSSLGKHQQKYQQKHQQKLR
jgi:hypothetical protein